MVCSSLLSTVPGEVIGSDRQVALQRALSLSIRRSSYETWENK